MASENDDDGIDIVFENIDPKRYIKFMQIKITVHQNPISNCWSYHRIFVSPNSVAAKVSSSRNLKVLCFVTI